jgi:hypothetical protein
MINEPARPEAPPPVTEIPKCKMGTDRIHRDSPPDAVVTAAIEWQGRDGVFMRRIRPLCWACFTDKAEEIREHAGEGEHSVLTVTARYPGGRTLPHRVGRSNNMNTSFVVTGDGT